MKELLRRLKIRWRNFLNARISRRRAAKGEFSTMTALGPFGGPIMLKEKVMDVGELASLIRTHGNEVFGFQIRRAMEMGERIIIDLNGGVIRERRALWCDLGYPNAPFPPLWENLKGRGRPVAG